MSQGVPRRLESRVERLVKARHSLNSLLEEATNDAANASSGNGLVDDVALQMTVKRIALARQELANAKRRRMSPEVYDVQGEVNATGADAAAQGVSMGPEDDAAQSEGAQSDGMQSAKSEFDVPEDVFDFGDECQNSWDEDVTPPTLPKLTAEQRTRMEGNKALAIVRRMERLRAKPLGERTLGELDWMNQQMTDTANREKARNAAEDCKRSTLVALQDGHVPVADPTGVDPGDDHGRPQWQTPVADPSGRPQWQTRWQMWRCMVTLPQWQTRRQKWSSGDQARHGDQARKMKPPRREVARVLVAPRTHWVLVWRIQWQCQVWKRQRFRFLNSRTMHLGPSGSNMTVPVGTMIGSAQGSSRERVLVAPCAQWA